jgi:hypothetical protein
LNRPIGLALDGFGNLYVADYYYLRVRQIQPNVLAVDFTQTPVRQGDISSPKLETLENDGNDLLSVTSLTPDTNSALGAASTPCVSGTSLAPEGSCLLGVEFAPSVAGDPAVGNIAIIGQSVDSPLNVVLVGNAPAVNSTTVALGASPSPSSFGQTVSITATVTTGSTTGALTGSVTFYDGTTKLQSPIVINGTNGSGRAYVSVSNLAVGSHSLWASYSGDTLHFASDNSTTPFRQVVNEGTATTVTSSANPSALGSAVNFKATVSIANGGGVTPDGTVTFLDGNTALATVPLVAGSATYTTSTLMDGAHAITASFSGDAATFISGSTSGVLNQDVLAASTVAITSGPNPSVYGTQVTFTATVTSVASVAPTGTVSFMDGDKPIATATLAGNTAVATFTTSALAAGTHAITAIYKGSPNCGPGMSTGIVQTVNLTQTTTTIAASPTPAIAGMPVTLTASVSVIAGSATVTGNMTFMDGTVKLGTATIGANGRASISPSLAPGAHAIVASYSGDGNDNPSASTAMLVNAALATTSVGLKSSSSPALVLSVITFTATVTSNGCPPSGSVIFAVDGADVSTASVGVNGTATFTYTPLSVGTHNVVAGYSGDTDNNPSTSTILAEVAEPIPTVTSLGASATPGPNPQAILVASALGSTGPVPAGTVTFTNADTKATIGSAALDSSGMATMVPDLPPGNYSVVASYTGDALHTPSASGAVTFSGSAIGFAVAANPPTITLASSQNSTITINKLEQRLFRHHRHGVLVASGGCKLPLLFEHRDGECRPVAVRSSHDTNSPLSGGLSASNATNSGRGLTLASLCWPTGLIFGFALWRFRKATRQRSLPRWFCS